MGVRVNVLPRPALARADPRVRPDLEQTECLVRGTSMCPRCAGAPPTVIRATASSVTPTPAFVDHRPREVELPHIAWEAQEFDLACKKKLDRLAGLAYIPRQPAFHGKEVCVWRKARQGSGRCRSDFPRN